MLITEDGTGKADAESLCDVAFANAYHKARGNETAWGDMDTPVKEQYLRLATDHMMQTYRSRWQGERVISTQALDWPRVGVVVDCYPVLSTVVPKEVKQACAELALKAKAGPLAPDLEQMVLHEKIGPIETTYSPTSSQNKRFVAIDRILAAYLNGMGGANVRLVRA